MVERRLTDYGEYLSDTQRKTPTSDRTCEGQGRNEIMILENYHNL